MQVGKHRVPGSSRPLCSGRFTSIRLHAVGFGIVGDAANLDRPVYALESQAVGKFLPQPAE